jgi:hypothetical protein
MELATFLKWIFYLILFGLLIIGVLNLLGAGLK